jgi:hypothetical protein
MSVSQQKIFNNGYKIGTKVLLYLVLIIITGSSYIQSKKG